MRERILRGLITTADVARLFDRTPQSVKLWVKLHGLPHIRIPGERRDTIRYELPAILGWAKRNGRKPIRAK